MVKVAVDRKDLIARLKALGNYSDYGAVLLPWGVMLVGDKASVFFVFSKRFDPATVADWLRQAKVYDRFKFVETGDFYPAVKFDCTNGFGTLEKLFEFLKKIAGLFGGKELSVLFVKRWNAGILETVVNAPSGLFVLTTDCFGFKYGEQVNFAEVEQVIKDNIKNSPELQSVKFEFLDK